MHENDPFSALLHWIGQALYFVVAAAFCVVSFVTTYQGFQTIFATWASAVAAVGVQAAMLAAWIFFGHNKAPARRIPWLCVGLFTCAISITFSYVGLRYDYMKNVQGREKPIHDKDELQAQRGRLQKAAAAARGLALSQIAAAIAEGEGVRGVAQLSQNGLKVKATEYRADIAALAKERLSLSPALAPEQRAAELDRIQKQAVRDERMLAFAEGSRESLGLKVQTEASALVPLRKLQEDIENYAPAFLDARDWTSLQREYDRMVNLLNETPGDDGFKAALAKATPEPPGPKLLAANGEVFDGEGHPIAEAFRHLARLERADLFVFAIAAALDLVPMLFTWALRKKKRTVPEAISALGTWMRRTRLALEAMEGVIPFTWNFWHRVFFSRPTRTGHESVLAFEEFISREQLRMDAALQQMVLPDALLEHISLETSYLHTRAIGIASERAHQFERLASQAYERCLAAVRNATGIDEQTRAELTRFLCRQMERFNATVSDYATEGEILDEFGRDRRKEQHEEGHQADDPQPPTGPQHHEGDSETEEATAARA